MLIVVSRREGRQVMLNLDTEGERFPHSLLIVTWASRFSVFLAES